MRDKAGVASVSDLNFYRISNLPLSQAEDKYLIQDLNSNRLTWTEYECGFKQHNEVGQHFPPIASKILKEIQSRI